MSNEKIEIDAEFAARLKNDIENLSPEARDYCRKELAEIDKPKEQPAPKYGDMTAGEFEAMKSKLMR
jgi:hypothetical protein